MKKLTLVSILLSLVTLGFASAMDMSMTPEQVSGYSGSIVDLNINVSTLDMNPGDPSCIASLVVDLPDNARFYAGDTIFGSYDPTNPGGGQVIMFQGSTFLPGTDANWDLKLEITKNISTGSFVTPILEYSCDISQPSTTITDTTTINPIAELVVSNEQLSLNPKFMGEEVGYKINISNIGNKDANGVTLTNYFPYQLNYVSSTPLYTSTSTLPSVNYVWENINIPANSDIDIYITGSLISNQIGSITESIAEVTYAEQLDTNDTSTATGMVEGVADGWINAKIIGDTPQKSGDLVNIIVEFGNSGNWYTNDTEMEIILPDEIKFIEFDTTRPKIFPKILPELQDWDTLTIETGDHNIKFSEFTLYENEEYLNSDGVPIVGVLTDNFAGTFTIQAHLSYSDREETDNNDDSEDIYIEGTPDLVVTKTHINSNPIFSGDDVVYEITYENIGSKEATGVSIIDTFPSELTGLTNNVLATGLTLDVGQTGSIIITGQLIDGIDAGTIFTNNVEIIYSEDEISNDNNVSLSEVMVGYAPDLTIDVSTTGNQPVVSGDIVTFNVDYQNIGNTGDTNVYIDLTNSGFDIISGTLNIGDLAVNQSGSIIVTGTLNNSYTPGTQICLEATIFGDIREIESNNGPVSACHTIDTAVDLFINTTLLTDFNTILSGEELSYRLDYGNQGTKDATGINITFDVSGEISLFDIPTTIEDLAAGQTGSVIITGTLNQITHENITITSTGTINFDSLDINPANNTSVSSDTILGLADLVISKTLISPNPRQDGDLVGFRIDYSNGGNRATSGIRIDDTLPAQLTFVSTNTVGTLSNSVYTRYTSGLNANTSGSILITGSLNIGSGFTPVFNNTASIETDSLESDTTNNTTTAEVVVEDYVNIQTNIQSYNQTRTNLNSFTPVQAVSGDVIRFTIDYHNYGSEIGENVELIFSLPINIASEQQTYNRNIGSLTYNSGSSFVVTGIVGPQGFMNATGLSTITYQVGGTGYVYTGEIVILEKPAVCGDGLLTQNEQCDTDGTNVIGTVLTGQSCQDIVGRCVLVTEDIINNACIDYTFNGVQQRKCTTLYIPYLQPDLPSQCEELDAIDGWVAILDDEDDEEDLRFRCTVANETYMQIDCGNGNESDVEYTDELTYECEYDDNDTDENIEVRCLVGNSSSSLEESNQCTETVFVDLGFLSDCGNGEKEGFEECDLGNDNGDKSEIIGRYLDDDKTDRTPSRYKDKGYYCSNSCKIKKGNDFAVNPPACFRVDNGNISVQEGEYLPFWWDLDKNKNIKKGDDCDDLDEGDIPEDSIKCTFKIYNGGSDYEEDAVYTRTVSPCNLDEWDDRRMFNYFIFNYNANDSYGRYAIELNEDITDGVYGEYKIVLDKVEYEYCDDDENDYDGKILERICETNFVVTKPYLAQKSAFAIKPKSTNLKLDGFKTLGGERLIEKTDLSKIMVLDESVYDGGTSADSIMYGFINKYDKLAITAKTINKNNASFNVKKVPGQQIFIFEPTAQFRDSKPYLLLNEDDWGGYDKPFTIIAKNTDLIIKGSITKTNGMFLAQGGRIDFQEENNDYTKCDKTQVVRGIFITDVGFGGFPDIYNTINTNEDKNRCPNGNLHIKGVLIGDDIDQLVSEKRSKLNGWFYPPSSSERTTETYRRNMIFNGASVLIEYSPSLRNSLPPGADSFTNILQVYKQ